MRVAVIGCGYWGKNLVRVFRDEGVLGAVCDSDEAGRLQAELLLPRPQYEDVKIVKTAHEVCMVNGIDAWAIVTSAESHYKLASYALKNRFHVFVEKPITLFYDEANQLFDLANERERVLFAGHVFVHHPAIQRILELKNTGYLGEITHLFSQQLGRGRVRDKEDVVMSLAPHDVSMLLALMGKLPEDVRSVGSEYASPDRPGVAAITLDWGDGVIGQIHVSWVHPEKVRRLVVVGTRRAVVFDDVAATLKAYDRTDDPNKPFGQAETVWFRAEEPLVCECCEFLQVVEQGQGGKQDFTQYRWVMDVLSRAREQSMRSSCRD